MSENNTSGGNSGISLPMSVISIIRHAITRFIAIAPLSCPAVLCARASIPHPDFSTRCQSSMRQRRQYHSMHFSASFGNFMSIVVSKNHSTACVPAGGFFFFHMDNLERYRWHLFKIRRRLQFCPYISNGYFGNTGCALTACPLILLFDSGALPGNLYGYPGLYR